VVLDNDSLFASVFSVEDNNNLAWLEAAKRRRIHNIEVAQFKKRL